MPAKPVGILGGGQLAAMLAAAAARLGLSCNIYDPAADCPAAALSGHSCAAWDDRRALARFAANADTITFEFEHIPPPALAQLPAGRMRPPLHALETARDRRLEKRLLQNLGMALAPWRELRDAADLRRADDALGLPMIIKTATGGYDGKGQRQLADGAALDALCADDALDALLAHGAIAESRLHFDRELSIIAARAANGQMAFYDLAENVHHQGILRISRNRPGDAMQPAAAAWARKLCEHLQYVGVLALECFEVDGALVANEFAPRVHNSGHWSIEATACSQFENHLRAITNAPLGDTASRHHAAMINCISTTPEPPPRGPGIHYHPYGKTPRPGRKLGHITICADTPAALESRLQQLPPP